MRPLIEICIGDAEGAIIAERAKADRVELCSDLFEGGLSPSIGTVRVVKKHTTIPVNAMVRPRGGDFCYSDIEFEVMKEEVKAFKAEGVNAIVFGILTPDGNIDVERSRELIEAARPLSVTFHRAFDMVKDPYKALQDLIDLGVDRILTSGLEATAYEGAELLAELVEIAGDRIVIMPGCGIKERNFRRIDSIIHAKEYHMSLSGSKNSQMTFHPGHIYMGGTLRQSEFSISCSDENKIRSMMSSLS